VIFEVGLGVFGVCFSFGWIGGEVKMVIKLFVDFGGCSNLIRVYSMSVAQTKTF